jgi:hypothetical protein
MDNHSMCEYDVIPEQVSQLGRRDSSRAQQAFTALLSNFVAGDGFSVVFGEYDQALSLEIVGEDGRHLVIAPLFKWEQGDDFESIWEWSIRGAHGDLLEHPGDEPPLGCSTTWGARDAGTDLIDGISFYRSALDESFDLAAFRPVPARDEDRVRAVAGATAAAPSAGESQTGEPIT